MPHNVNTPVEPSISPFHGKLTDFFMAGAPQLIPLGNNIIYDYFKSFPTVYMHTKSSFGWMGTGDKNDPTIAHQIAIATAMWIGGQALMVDILLSGIAEASTALPYLRAIVCGEALKGFSDLWTGSTHGKYYEWIPNMFLHDEKKLEGMRSLLAFLVGFMGAKNNVGGGPWSTGGHIGLATASAMIGTPYLFLHGASPGPYEYSVGDYMKLVFFYALTMGGISRLLSSRVSPMALSVLTGVLNAFLQDKRVEPVLFQWLHREYPITAPPPHKVPPPVGGRMMSPLVSYTAY